MATHQVTRAMLQDAEADGIPVIDMQDYLSAKPSSLERTAEKVQFALETVGFLVVINHGIPAAMIDGIFDQAARFHALPIEEKMRIKTGSGFVGYLPSKQFVIKTSEINDNKKADVNEAFLIDRERAADDPEVLSGKPFREVNKWPKGLPGFREETVTYFKTVEGFAKSLLPLYAHVLELPQGYFDKAFKEPQSTLRLSHYPPADYEDNEFGIAPHTDATFMTILPQGKVEGLFVRPAGRGWMKAPKIAGSLIINTGDILKRWTNDRFMSTEHLAVNPTPDKHRYAAPFFMSPNTDHPISCIPTCCSSANPPKYPDTTFEEYRLWFMKNNYQAKADQPSELMRP